MYLIVKMQDGKRWFCCKAIGGRYYHRLAQILSEGDSSDLVDPPPPGRVIIMEGDGAYLVTMPSSEGGNKLPWVRCANIAHAERMVAHVK